MATRPVCAYCRQQPVDATWRPFCSERCKMIDLGAWAAEHYRVASKDDKPAPDSDER